MKDVKNYYDKTATDWSNEFYEEKNKDVIDKFYECFNQAGTISPKILDLGCGVGYDSKYLIFLGANVVGVDISEKSIEIAEREVEKGKFFVGDITDKLNKLGKFDGVICLSTINHINIEQLKNTFENISEILHEGGLLLVSSHDGMGKNMKKSLVKVDGKSFDQNFNNYSAETICSIAYPYLKLVDTWKFDDFDDGWRYYVFMKPINRG